MRITKKLIVVGAGVVALVAGGSVAAVAATSAAPKVTAEKAIEIAHKEVPGAWVSELDYDKRGSRPDAWELELTKGAQLYEVDVDATTGKVTDRQTKQSDGEDDNDD